MAQHIVFVEASVTGAGALANRFAQEQALRVTLLSRRPHDYAEPILSHTDEIIRCDTNDVAALEHVVRELHARQPIHGITTTADFYVPQAAYVARSLGLTAMSHEAALGARNKFKMRVRLQERCPELNPRFALAQDEAEALAIADAWGLPLIAKPQDLNDGEHVRLIRTRAQLEAYVVESRQRLVNASGQHCARGALLEEFVDGVEFSIETLQSKGGPIQLIGVTTKDLVGFDRRYFVETGHSFPVLGPEVDLLFRATSRALHALEIDCGVIHTECRIRDGQVKVMEVNPRLAGGKIGSHLVELATGENPVRAVIDIAMGRQVRWNPPRRNGSALYFVPSPQRAIFEGLLNEAEVRAMEGVVDVISLLPPGATVRPPESNGDMVAMVIVEGPSEPVAFRRARAAARSVRLRLQAERGVDQEAPR